MFLYLDSYCEHVMLIKGLAADCSCEHVMLIKRLAADSTSEHVMVMKPLAAAAGVRPNNTKSNKAYFISRKPYNEHRR